MEFTTKEELYHVLNPVFRVKKRLLNITKYKDVNELDIWNYLIINKWKNSHNLMINEVVNDIIMFNPEKILYIDGGNNEEK